MKMLDLYYRAYRALKKHTTDDVNSKKFRRTSIHADSQNDSLTTIKYECTIEEDWIINIEEGLIFIEKAIAEERQFIRTEGEVIPIEKVKKVSRTSIEHLSKHSDYITRKPKGTDDLIPDKLYIIEKLNDYLVYENRFIFMLLSYLKDFIQIRIEDIKDKTTTYKSFLNMNKNIEENQRHIHYELKYDDVYKNDPFLVEAYEKIANVKRVETIYATVIAFLNTPLMKEVAKAPMIKPPVVKTNVLRMNQNFRAALTLYDYVASYAKKGYSFTEIKKIQSPFNSDFAEDMAETIQLTSTLSYIEGNQQKEILNSRLNAYENELLEIEKNKSIKALQILKKRLIELQEDPFEYIHQLEIRNDQLEKESQYLFFEKEKNKNLEKTIELLINEKEELSSHIENLDLVISENDLNILKMQEKYYTDLSQAEKTHQIEIIDLKKSFEQTMIDMNNSHILEINQLKESFKQQELKVIDIYENKIMMINQNIEVLKNNETLLVEKIQHLNNENLAKENDFYNQIQMLQEEIYTLDEEKKSINAQYLGLRYQQGMLTDKDDFTSKEKFKQLESEMIAYKKFFKNQWKKTRVKIREKVKKEVFSHEGEEETSINDHSDIV